MVFVMKSKADIINVFRAFQLPVDNLSDCKIKTLHFDGVKEFLSHKFSDDTSECRHFFIKSYVHIILNKLGVPNESTYIL